MNDEWGAGPALSIDRMRQILGELADELPDEIYRGLNLGIIVLEETKLHAESRSEKPLYTMGLYVRNNMGRQIIIYYGSVMQVYGHLPEERLRVHLRDILHHELLHHLEHQGGEFGLEFEDHLQLQDYRAELKNNNKDR